MPPSKSEIMAPAGHLRLAGYLIKRQADDVRTLRKNGDIVLQLSFRQ